MVTVKHFTFFLNETGTRKIHQSVTRKKTGGKILLKDNCWKKLILIMVLCPTIISFISFCPRGIKPRKDRQVQQL